MTAGNPVPLLSVGLAVRNDAQQVRRCIESVLSQDFADIELVICDNASDDDTVDTLKEYARADGRVAVSVNPANIGIHGNMNRVLELSRGNFFRWISSDDWLESHAVSMGVRTLERSPAALGVTSGFTLHAPGEAPHIEHYPGEFPSSSDPSRRFERLLWLFHAGLAKYDPVYGIYRREQLLRSGRLRPNERADWLLSAELALMGPIVHIPDPLAHRTVHKMAGVDRAALRRRQDPVRGELLKSSPTGLYHAFDALVQSSRLTEEQVRRCHRALRRFWLREAKRANRMRASDLRHRVRSLSHERAGHS